MKNTAVKKIDKLSKTAVRPGPAAIVVEKLIMDNMIFLHNAKAASMAHALVRSI